MSLGPLIDISLGIILVILVLSLIASGVQEMVSSLLALRARNLRSVLRSILNNRMLDEIYAHGRIRMLGRPHGSAPAMPSYIPTHTLAIALTDLAFPESGQASPLTPEALLRDIDKLEESPIKDALRSIVKEVGTDLDAMRERLAISFDESMDRISGWYARYVKYTLLGIGLGIAVVLNIDVFRLAAELWINADLRAGLAGLALEARGGGHLRAAAGLAGETFRVLAFRLGARLRDRRCAFAGSRLASHRFRGLVGRAVLVRHAEPHRQPARRGGEAQGLAGFLDSAKPRPHFFCMRRQFRAAGGGWPRLGVQPSNPMPCSLEEAVR